MSDWTEAFARHSPGIQLALDAGGDDIPLAEVERMLAAEEAQLWTYLQSGLITRVLDHPMSGKREMLVWLGWGSLRDLERMLLPQAEHFGARSGAHYITVIGRLGWMRSFLTKTAGYTPQAVQFIKEIPS